jgi:hypothetical protein
MNLALRSLHAWSVFVPPLERESHWTRAQTSWVYTIAIVCFALAFVAAGRVQDLEGAADLCAPRRPAGERRVRARELRRCRSQRRRSAMPRPAHECETAVGVDVIFPRRPTYLRRADTLARGKISFLRREISRARLLVSFIRRVDSLFVHTSLRPLARRLSFVA